MPHGDPWTQLRLEASLSVDEHNPHHSKYDVVLKRCPTKVLYTLCVDNKLYYLLMNIYNIMIIILVMNITNYYYCVM